MVRQPARLIERRASIAKVGLDRLERRLLFTADLLGDFNINTDDSQPLQILRAGNIAYFTADDGIHGRELWRTDGTAAGTFMVADIDQTIPYRDENAGSSNPRNLTVVGDTLYFIAGDGVNSRYTLWKTDGTTAGTVRLLPTGIDASTIFPLGENILFGGGDATTGDELWISDGTPAGTRLLRDIRSGPGHSFPGQFAAIGDGRAFFRACDDLNGCELWTTDGTSQGTRLVRDIDPGPEHSAPFRLTAIDDVLYFVAETQLHGSELWRSDGTASGTRLVRDLNPGSDDSHPSDFTPFNGRVYFTASDGGPAKVWSTDGTAAGTRALANVSPPLHPHVRNLTVIGDKLYFRAFGTSAGYELWKSDGTTAGTVLVKDINPGATSSNPRNLTVVGQTLFFSATSNDTVRLWKTDGSEAGTVPLGEAISSEIPYLGAAPILQSLNGRLLFSAIDPRHGSELWISDGTSQGTSILADINRDTISSNVTLAGAGGHLLISHYTGASTYQLSRIDGGPGGAIVPLKALEAPSTFVDYRGWAYFRADDGQSGTELWKTDGTAEGTTIVADIFPGPGDGLIAGPFRGPGDVLYLVARRQTAGVELWKSDGTADGTTYVSTLDPVWTAFSVDEFHVSGQHAYFRWGNYVWHTDGTPQGTARVANNLITGFGAPLPGPMAVANGVLYYAGLDSVRGPDLWTSDGTPEGTSVFKQLNPGVLYGGPQNFVSAHGKIFFVAYTAGAWDLFQSDGSSDGTLPVVRLSSTVRELIPFAGGLLFDQKSDLWWTDGTQAGTRLVAAGVTPYYYVRHLVADERYYFRGTDAEGGAELWTSDGTPEGTARAFDLNPGPVGSAPSFQTFHDGVLYFIAYDGVHGYEPWKWIPFASRKGREIIVNPAGEHERLIVSSYGDALRLTLDEATLAFSTRDADLLNISESLPRLELDGTISVEIAFVDAKTVSLILNDQSRARLRPEGKTISLSSVDISPSAVLDLADNSLLISSSCEAREETLRQVTAAITSARNTGTGLWTGTGLTSSAAAADPFTTLAVGLLGDDIVVKHTWNGDANLDGRVNADDYFRIDSGFLAQPPDPAYAQGDFNYDGKINADDYFLIDSAFLGQAGAAEELAAVVASTARAGSAQSVSPPVDMHPIKKRGRTARPAAALFETVVAARRRGD